MLKDPIVIVLNKPFAIARILTPTTLSISAASVKIAKRRVRRRSSKRSPGFWSPVSV